MRIPGRYLVFALLLGACSQNREALDAALAMTEANLSAAQERADGLNELRVEVAGFEARVRARATTPEAQGLVRAALDDEAPAKPPPSLRAPPLPPEGRFEGAEGARLRRQIAENNQRLAMLEKVLEEVDALQARRARIQATSALLESLSDAPK